MLSVASVHPHSLTAGLSPNGDERVEVFLAGCRMAQEGHPCLGCFNKDLWDGTLYPQLTPEELYEDIKAAGNKYVTIVGGEPLDQYPELVKLLKLLKADSYHVVLITHYTMEVVVWMYPEVLDYVNVVIDGVYRADKRIFDELQRPGVLHVIGSSNQTFWHKTDNEGWTTMDLYKDELREAYCA